MKLNYDSDYQYVPLDIPDDWEDIPVLIPPTRNNCWRGTKGHSKDKSRFYETWYKAIRNANTKYQKQYYDKREYEKFLSQLNDTY